MSQHYFKTKKNRQVLYGFDAPTGGFFYTEFLREDELEELDAPDETNSHKDGMTLTDFLSEVKKFEIEIPVNVLLRDFFQATPPTPLQVKIGRMFGKDILSMLDDVVKDIRENYYEK